MGGTIIFHSGSSAARGAIIFHDRYVHLNHTVTVGLSGAASVRGLGAQAVVAHRGLRTLTAGGTIKSRGLFEFEFEFKSRG